MQLPQEQVYWNDFLETRKSSYMDFIKILFNLSRVRSNLPIYIFRKRKFGISQTMYELWWKMKKCRGMGHIYRNSMSNCLLYEWHTCLVLVRQYYNFLSILTAFNKNPFDSVIILENYSVEQWKEHNNSRFPLYFVYCFGLRENNSYLQRKCLNFVGFPLHGITLKERLSKHNLIVRESDLQK